MALGRQALRSLLHLREAQNRLRVGTQNASAIASYTTDSGRKDVINSSTEGSTPQNQESTTHMQALGEEQNTESVDTSPHTWEDKVRSGQQLDFGTAMEELFEQNSQSGSRPRYEDRFDWHAWQLFAATLPALAAYAVAQWLTIDEQRTLAMIEAANLQLKEEEMDEMERRRAERQDASMPNETADQPASEQSASDKAHQQKIAEDTMDVHARLLAMEATMKMMEARLTALSPSTPDIVDSAKRNNDSVGVVAQTSSGATSDAEVDKVDDTGVEGWRRRAGLVWRGTKRWSGVLYHSCKRLIGMGGDST